MSERKRPGRSGDAPRDDLDIPELTKEDFARMRPAREVFPNLDFPRPRIRGPQKTPTKIQTTIRIDREVIEHFRSLGRGWQSRMNDALRATIARERKSKRG